MAPQYRLPLEVFRVGQDGERTSIGIFDFAYEVASNLRSNPNAFPPSEEPGMEGAVVYVHQIVNALPREFHDLAYSRELAFPGLDVSVAAFRSGMTKSEVAEVVEGLTRLRSAEEHLDLLKKELARVLAAEWVTDLGRFEMIQADHLGGEDGYVSLGDPEEGISDWGYDSYIAMDPRPEFTDEPAVKAWEARYQKWLRASAPPYAYGTTEDVWPGIRPTAVKAAYEDGEEGNFEDLVDSSLEQHHEDARDRVKGIDEGSKIVDLWLAARDADPEGADRAMERDLTAWNAKQSIISYYVDHSVLVPIFKDATKTEAVAYCERQIADHREKLQAIIKGLEQKSVNRPGFVGGSNS